MRVREHLTYANVMATIAVFGVLAGGGAYAASKIDTKDIADKAITPRKLRPNAVKTSKISPRAVRNTALADGAVDDRSLSQDVSLPMAGVIVYNGEIRGWFNRFNDQMPTLEHTEPGVYDLSIPGLSEDLTNSSLDLLSSVSLTSVAGPQAGEISARLSQYSDGSNLRPIISTYDSGGNPSDRAFTYLVYHVDHRVQ